MNILRSAAEYLFIQIRVKKAIRTSYCAWLEVGSKSASLSPPYKELLTEGKGSRGNKGNSVTVQPHSKCSWSSIICWL